MVYETSTPYERIFPCLMMKVFGQWLACAAFWEVIDDRR